MRNLIILRAGDASLHTEWLGNESERNWDIIVYYYGDDPNIFRDKGQRRIDGKGAKWSSLYELMQKMHGELEAYDYVWFPDDDLASDMATINAFFDMCHTYALDLAQPSLSFDSIIAHLITANNHAFKLRFTTFVESMAPCFSRRFLQRCWQSFGMNVSGYGLDFLWPTWAETMDKVAIIDSVSVRHTRSKGSLYDIYKQRGISPEQEFEELLAKENLRPIRMTLGGVDHAGQTHAIWNDGHKKLIEKLIAGYLPQLVNHPEHIYGAIEPIFAFMGKGKN